ncbi:MAG: iron chaperone [Acidimicrobiia bacterium]
MRSDATTVEEYLGSLEPDRRDAIETVRAEILANLPDGYEEAMNWGMITYQVPLETFPDTYNGQPLMYAGLASQKNHMAVYLTAVYADEETREEFEAAYRTTGKRMDMGKSCVRFRKLDDLPLDLIGKTIAEVEVDTFVTETEAARQAYKKRKK